jgi:hypothetical protein
LSNGHPGAFLREKRILSLNIDLWGIPVEKPLKDRQMASPFRPPEMGKDFFGRPPPIGRAGGCALIKTLTYFLQLFDPLVDALSQLIPC